MLGTPPYFKPKIVERKSLDPSRGGWRISTKSGRKERATCFGVIFQKNI